jgi:ribosome-binding factor A
MAKQRRVHKIAEQIRNCIALQLQRVADPRFSLVTITSAVVSPDLRNAKVYWMVSGDAERRDDVSEAFANAAGLFRRAIGAELGIRFVPELRFFYDDTFDQSDSIAQLFGRIHAENEARGGDGEEDQVSDEEPR